MNKQKNTSDRKLKLRVVVNKNNDELLDHGYVYITPLDLDGVKPTNVPSFEEFCVEKYMNEMLRSHLKQAAAEKKKANPGSSPKSE